MIWGEDRAQTVQIGAVLLFGTLIVSMAMFQAMIVPTENKEIEYKHNLRAQEQLVDLRNALLRTGATGDARPTSVSLGTKYPTRTFYLNPPPATGKIETTDLGDVTISNAVIKGDTGDYWTGDTRTFATKGLVYEPDYAEYDGPTTRYEHSVVFNEFSNDAEIVETDQGLVDGRRINLAMLGGDLSETKGGAVSVDSKPVSATTRTVPVRNSGDGPITISFRTHMSQAKWRKLLNGELDPGNADPEAYISSFAYDSSTTPSTVTLTFEEDTTYELRMAKVGVGSGVDDPGPHYVVGTDTNDLTVTTTQTANLKVEVRDRFNNRQSGVPVVLEASAGTFSNDASSITVNTDADGWTEVTYIPPQQGSQVTVTAKADVDGDNDYDLAREQVEYNIHVISLPSSASSILSAGNNHLYLDNGTGGGPDDNPYGFSVDITNTAKETATITGIAINRTSTEADRYWEEAGTSENDHGAWKNEIFIDVTDSPNVLNDTEGDGHYEMDDAGDLIKIPEKVDLATEKTGIRNNVSVIDPGTEGRMYVYRFWEGSGGGTSSYVEMKGEVVRMTIYYTVGGTQHEYMFDLFLL